MALFGLPIFLWTLVVFTSPTVAGPNRFAGIDLKSDKKIEIDLKRASRGTVVVFLSSRCPCSASHTSEIASLAQEFSSEGFQFVFVHSNVDETEATDRVYLKSLNLNGPILEDHDSEIANRFGALKTPHAFVVSPSGSVVYGGAVSDRSNFSDAKSKYLRSALNQIAQGVVVSPSKTMAIGCVIRR